MNKINWRRVPLDCTVSAVLLYSAYFISKLLLPNTGAENNSALVFVLAIVIISWVTDGFAYGIFASLSGTVLINWYFMEPYGEFNYTFQGYPVAIVSTLTIALIVCTLTHRLKHHARTAEERERRTRELYEQNTRLEKERSEMELNAIKAGIRSNILMSVSHDLRTPLTAIAGSASVILNQSTPEHTAENLDLVQDIKDEAEWLSIMVENIISVAKLQGGNDQLKLKPEIPDEIIESCVVKIHRLFPQSNIHLHLTEDVAFVLADPILIRQVLQNLLENAIRHSGSDGPFEISTRRVEDSVEFAVRDHGQGIPENILSQIREGRQVVAESNGDRSRRSGIGLSACQSILQAHRSRLCAENPQDGGALFSFRLKASEISE